MTQMYVNNVITYHYQPLGWRLGHPVTPGLHGGRILLINVLTTLPVGAGLQPALDCLLACNVVLITLLLCPFGGRNRELSLDSKVHAVLSMGVLGSFGRTFPGQYAPTVGWYPAPVQSSGTILQPTVVCEVDPMAEQVPGSQGRSELRAAAETLSSGEGYGGWHCIR